MGFLRTSVLLLVSLAATQAMAWGNHALASYRAFEKMPEVAAAPTVVAEPLESFLRAEENTIEALLASQEAWARANLDKYPARPAALAFTADYQRSDEARRNAFLMALRVAPNSKFALYFQTDPWDPASGTALPSSAVSTLPDNKTSLPKFLAIRPGDSVPALAVLATASEEPMYGLDVNLWEDSPSDWGRLYGFGPQPFGFSSHASASQAPFHMAFLHENRALNLAAPQLKRSYVLLRSHQFSTLAALAFRTGHGYWGWRFAGLSLHYVQELTQPFQTQFAPGESTGKLLAANALAVAGLSSLRDELLVLLANRQAVLNKYQAEMLERASSAKSEGPLEKALRFLDKDKNYPEWNDRYLRDVVSAQASAIAAPLAQALVANTSATYVSDTSFDFCAKETGINLLGELTRRDPAERVRLENAIAELMGNLGAHSRNALRGILRASTPP